MAKKIRLNKLLQERGIASRRKADDLIAGGEVRINGKVVTQLGLTIDLDETVVTVGEQELPEKEPLQYFLFHKPKGCVCSNRAFGKEKRVIDFFAGMEVRLFTVGRLDKDTTGLLIVTNDGTFAGKAIHPSSNIVKTYIATVDRALTPEGLETVRKGTEIEGVHVLPRLVKQRDPHSLLIEVTEGKKREIRHLTRAGGFKTVALHRIRLGKLELPDIPAGSYIPLNPEDRLRIFK
ncbi:MAG: hypothetical protein A3F09_06155 [Chlamydiae bacterium RIFCSPHIGHO2_12_FULL_49_11]|nr:MAG: hypothetical protein A3F09_06155 [Chlamydiae bacterium RIFCSPHIGHO2_12_FULL_49_11]